MRNKKGISLITLVLIIVAILVISTIVLVVLINNNKKQQSNNQSDTKLSELSNEEKENYCLSTKVVNVCDTFTVGNDLINFSTKLECGIVGNKTDAVLYSNIEYPIYLNVEKYIIESTERINNIGIMINDKRTKLSDLDYQIKSRGGYNDYIIDLKLDSNEIYSLYAFKINDDTEISKSRINFAIADTLNYSSKQLDNEKYEINVSSSLFDSNVNEILNIKTNKDLIISSFVNSKEYDLFLKFTAASKSFIGHLPLSFNLNFPYATGAFFFAYAISSIVLSSKIISSDISPSASSSACSAILKTA